MVTGKKKQTKLSSTLVTEAMMIRYITTCNLTQFRSILHINIENLSKFRSDESVPKITHPRKINVIYLLWKPIIKPFKYRKDFRFTKSQLSQRNQMHKIIFLIFFFFFISEFKKLQVKSGKKFTSDISQ